MKNCKLQSQVKNSQEVKDRAFEVVVYEQDYKELCSWVLRHKNIETGGDLFGLWSDDRTAVVQLVLGPGMDCRRTGTSFYQDLRYLEDVGSYLTSNEGLCHIGEWHSHHQLGLARPSGGDESTVWNNMPTYSLDKFVIFIANLEEYASKVNIGCFLFEYENKKQLSVLPGRFKVLPGKSPFGEKSEIQKKRKTRAEPPEMTAREREAFIIDYIDREVRNIAGVLESYKQKRVKKRRHNEVALDKKKMQKGASLKGKSGSSADESLRLLYSARSEELVLEQPTTNTSTVPGKTGQNGDTVYGRICKVLHTYLCPRTYDNRNCNNI